MPRFLAHAGCRAVGGRGAPLAVCSFLCAPLPHAHVPHARWHRTEPALMAFWHWNYRQQCWCQKPTLECRHHTPSPISKAPMHARARNDCINICGRLAACTRTQAHIPHVQPPRITGTCPLTLGVHLSYFGTLTVTCTVAFKVTITECHIPLQIWLW